MPNVITTLLNKINHTLLPTWFTLSPARRVIMLSYFVAAVAVYYFCLTAFGYFFFSEIFTPVKYKSQIIHTLVVLTCATAELNARHIPLQFEPLLASILAIVYMAYLCFLSFAIGLTSLSTGAVAGALLITIFSITTPLVGYIISFMLGCVFIVLLTLTYYSIIPYAPDIEPVHYQMNVFSIRYFALIGIMLAPLFIPFLLVCMHITSVWKKREKQIIQLNNSDLMLNIANRRSIITSLEKSLSAHNQSLTLPLHTVMVDIDLFKHINDSYGHPMGDQVLIAVSHCLKNTLSPTHKLGRYGGEEFLILINNCTHLEAIAIAEQCRIAIQTLQIWSEGQHTYIKPTASFGLYSTLTRPSHYQTLIEHADACLYQAKQSGRNQVVSRYQA